MNALYTCGEEYTCAWFHWPCQANEVRFIEDWMTMLRACAEPTLSKRKNFECGVPPRPRHEPGQVRTKLFRSWEPATPRV